MPVTSTVRGVVNGKNKPYPNVNRAHPTSACCQLSAEWHLLTVDFQRLTANHPHSRGQKPLAALILQAQPWWYGGTTKIIATSTSSRAILATTTQLSSQPQSSVLSSINSSNPNKLPLNSHALIWCVALQPHAQHLQRAHSKKCSSFDSMKTSAQHTTNATSALLRNREHNLGSLHGSMVTMGGMFARRMLAHAQHATFVLSILSLAPSLSS